LRLKKPIEIEKYFHLGVKVLKSYLYFSRFTLKKEEKQRDPANLEMVIDELNDYEQ
jgi:hypothetical protein